MSKRRVFTNVNVTNLVAIVKDNVNVRYSFQTLKIKGIYSINLFKYIIKFIVYYSL